MQGDELRRHILDIDELTSQGAKFCSTIIDSFISNDTLFVYVQVCSHRIEPAISVMDYFPVTVWCTAGTRLQSFWLNIPLDRRDNYPEFIARIIEQALLCQNGPSYEEAFNLKRIMHRMTFHSI
jgi:hypothetical protein